MAKQSNLKKILAVILCVALVLNSGLFESVLNIKAAKEVRYLSDIRLFYVENKKSSDEAAVIARMKCEMFGYTFLNYDLNSGTGKDWVYIGYKTTTNRDMAITDIRLLGMDSGYYLYDYEEILAYLKNSNTGTAYNLYNAANDLAAKYEAGSPKAADAVKGLNLFYVQEKSGKLGDLILNGKADIDFFNEVIVKASTGTVNAIMNFLNMGIAPYELPDNVEKPEIAVFSGDGSEENTTELYTDDDQSSYYGVTWADALSNGDLETLRDDYTTAEKNELHKKYNDDARDVFKQLQTFATLYENAAARNEDGAEAALETLESDLRAEKIESDTDAVESMENMEAKDADSMYLSAYDTLNQYTNSDGRPLGDWILEIGLQTTDEVDITTVYPIVEAMGKAQTGLVKAAGIMTAVSNLSGNEANNKMSELLPKVQAAIRDYNNGQCLPIWDTADDDIEESYIAYTSDAVRVHNANESIGKRERFDIIDEKLTNVLNWINTISAIAVVVVWVTKSVVGAVSTYCAGVAACAGLSAFLSGAGAALAVASSALMWVGIAVLAVSIGWAIGKWIASLIKKADPTIKHSNYPAYVFDVADTPNGTVTVKYKTALDENGEFGDVNARQQTNWAVLCYTTETQIGSPIMADDSGNIFRVYYGDGRVHSGYDCINQFGERNPANLNYLTEKDKNDGIYVSYRTERSLAQGAPESTDNEAAVVDATEYLSDIVVSVGSTAMEAKAKIMVKAGSYYILDQNLSPNTDNYTYLGYSMTTDPNDAITDIRVAPYQGNGNITFGDIQYTFIGHVGINTGSDTSQTAGDAILKTKDPRAGSPIIADGLHIVRDPKKATPGWEPVIMFSGLLYDFASCYYEEKNDRSSGQPWPTYVSGRWAFDKVDWDHREKCVDHQPVYIYFEPTEQYTSGEKYLQSIFFVSGTDSVRTDWMKDQGLYDFDLLWRELEKDPYCWGIKDHNLYQAVTGKWELPMQYIGFKYTYNPKRAITDITVFQGDAYTACSTDKAWTQNLPYNFAKPHYETGVTMGYTATNTISISIRGYKEYEANRYFLNSYNMIYGPTAGGYEKNREGTSYHVYSEGYTKLLPEGFTYGYDRTDTIPTGLYLSGPAEGKDPLKLSDVVVSTTRFDGKLENGVVTFNVTGKTLAGGAAQGSFRSIAEIKNPHSTTAFDIASPTWYSKKSEITKNAPMFIYIRDNGTNVVKKYLSSVAVGYYSIDQYKKDVSSQKQNVDDKELKYAYNSINLNAMLSAACSGADEMIGFNLSAPQEKAWYNDAKDGEASMIAPEEDIPASYIAVTRTDKKAKAITGILLYQNNDTVTAQMIKVDGADYYCDSTTSPILMNGKRYYLYYTRNIGINSGVQVTGLKVDTNPMGLSGEYTVLCANPGDEKPYGDPKLPYYIHMESEERSGAFLTELYIGKGVSERETMCDLISQECCRFLYLDLNLAVSETYLYLGYSINYLDPNATAKQKKTALNEAIYDLIVTKNEPFHEEGFVHEKNNVYYAPVSNINLNYGNDDADVLYLYYCSPYRSSRYNKEQKKLGTGIVTTSPEEVFSAPISKLALARYDRVPYLTKLAGTGETGNEITPWEYVMFSNERRQADFTSGSAKFETEGYVTDNRVTMFAQRYDGSVKPSAEITGGFISEWLEKGVLSAKQRLTGR